MYNLSESFIAAVRLKCLFSGFKNLTFVSEKLGIEFIIVIKLLIESSISSITSLSSESLLRFRMPTMLFSGVLILNDKFDTKLFFSFTFFFISSNSFSLVMTL